MNFVASLDWGYIWDHKHALLDGLRWTIQVSIIGILGSTVIGIVFGACRAARVPVVGQIAAVYVEVIRNTPILVQIFFIFFGLPELSDHLRFSPYRTACIVLILWGGAFNTENYRAGFEAVPKRYREAALALGFTPFWTFFRITLPIGGRIALPSTINTYVSVVKNSALVYAIGFEDLNGVARTLAANDFTDLEMTVVVAVVYLALVWGLSSLIRLLERRLSPVPAGAR